MSAASEIALYLSRAFLLATVATALYAAWRRRDPHRLDILVFFLALAAPLFIGQGLSWLSLVRATLIAAQPFLLLRLVRHVASPPGWLQPVAIVAVPLVPVAWSLWPDTLPLRSFDASVYGYGGAAAALAALAFFSETHRTAGVARKRLWYAALASSVFAAAHVVAATAVVLPSDGILGPLSILLQLLQVPIYGFYFLAFSTPRRLIARWQLVEQARYLTSTAARAPEERGAMAAADLNRAAEHGVSHALTFVALRSSDGERLRVEASSDAGLVGCEWPVGPGLPTRVVTSRQAEQGSVSACPPDIASTLAPHGAALLAAPVVTSDRVWGVVAAVQRRGSLFPEDDLDLLAEFGRHAGIALDHARLIHEARERERASADRKIREVESRMGLMLDSIKDYAMMIVDHRGRVLHWPVGAEHVFGYQEQEVADEPAAALFQMSDDRFLGLLDEARQLGRARREGPCRRRDGETFLGSTIIRPLGGAGGEAGYVAVTRDDTERRALEDRLRQSQKMEAIGQLAGGIAHDFNNLLTAILGYADWLAAGMPTDDPHRPQVAEIQRAAERGAGLTRKLLTFSRDQMLEPEAVNLARLIAEMAPMLRRMIGEHIEIVHRADDDLSPVLADRTQVEQVVLNLAVNARDAMPAGGTLAIATSNVWLDDEQAAHEIAPGRFVCLEVSDTGVGMDAATRARIFEPFFTTKDPGHGTGLGLATVYGIVRQMGGVIRVASQPREGASFKLFIPASTGEARPRPAVPEPELAGSETILVVEDDVAVRRFIALVLRQHGYTVLEASDRASALQAVENWNDPIHLVVADVLMPRGTGPELVRALAQFLPEAPALFISGYADAVLAREATLPKASHFLQKPFSAADLLARIRQLLTTPR